MDRVRNDFPILKQMVNDEDLVYLDNAATSQKPQAVIDSLVRYYQHDNANVHRGVHTLANRATTEYEAVRQQVQQFIHAESASEIIFTKGTTDSLNLVAATYGEREIQAGDEIVLTYLEHHSNLIPWQQLALKKQATLKYIGLTATGELDLADAEAQITDKTKIVAVTHVSNVLGTITPIKELAAMAHKHNAVIVVDGAQAAPHVASDVQKLGADYYAFSGHKMLGPTGIGVLYGRKALLEKMPPYQYGGEMIDLVQLYDSTWTDLPWKFEAGTQNIAGVIGLGAALDYLTKLGMDKITAYEQDLTNYLLPKLLAQPGVTVYGPEDPAQHTDVFSFNVEGIHPHDVATALDLEGIAVRAGHHCAQPLMNYLGIQSSVRASFYLYNSPSDADRLLAAITETKEFFNHHGIG